MFYGINTVFLPGDGKIKANDFCAVVNTIWHNILEDNPV